MADQAVVVIAFDVPEDLHTGVLWQKAADALKPLVEETENLRLFIATDVVAQAVIDQFGP